MYRFFNTLKDAGKSFFSLKLERPKHAPFLRDCIDLKRVMILVVMALIPCALIAWINTGLQSFVYGSFNENLMQEYLHASQSIATLLTFIGKYIVPILWQGGKLFFIPLVIIYTTGGIIEAIFATIEKKPISEGFLVTGILTALILPPTLPYWMLVVGTGSGLILSKELFGGTGMNVFNPALTIRCILYFTFPTYMTGQVFVGQNPTEINRSLIKMQVANVTAASALAFQNSLPASIKNIHVHMIGSEFNNAVCYTDQIKQKLNEFNPTYKLYQLTPDQIKEFVTQKNGLDLGASNFKAAYNFAKLYFGIDLYSNKNLIAGNMIGSMGETCKIAIILGALFLLIVKLASLRIMVFTILGAVALNLAFQLTTNLAFDSAAFSLPIYKQFLIGSLLFALVFMATEPVTAPKNKKAQCIYGFVIGVLTILIRFINPAYVEGAMLAVLIANAFSSLFDYYMTLSNRKKIRRRSKKLLAQKDS